MLDGVQSCFQLLRIGPSSGDSARDLYTFRPELSRSVFRLGRSAELCDVTLESTLVSRIHAELHVERESSGGEEPQQQQQEEEEEGWRVHIKDRSSHGTWVNEVRLQPDILWELSDGDTLTFGGQSASGSPEFYFLFQKVKVRPLDFDAITIPKAGTFSSDLQNRIRTSQDRKVTANLDLSKLSINRATVILNSIGSLSKMKGSAWTFRRSHSLEGAISNPGAAAAAAASSSSLPLTGTFSPLVPPCTSPSFTPPTLAPSTKSLQQQTSRSRRKSAHTVLLEDDGSDEPRIRGAMAAVVEDGQRPQGKKRRRLYKSESDRFSSPPPLQPRTHNDPRRPMEVKPFPVGIRTIGSFHGAMTNSRLNHQHLLQASFTNVHRQDGEVMRRVKTVVHGNINAFRQQKPVHSPQTAARGRRRANSSPVFSPLVVGGENYNLASPPPTVRISAQERSRMQLSRFHHPTSKRRGRPRKHPLPPRPSLPSPSSSSSSSSSSASSSGSSSSSDEEEDEDDEEEEAAAVGTVEPCAAPRCRLPQQDTVQWIQCDVCDAWYHIDCLHVDRKKLLMDPTADFHCGCR
ncbi:transcription factor 19 [Pholidichthys leucotaenia]